MMILKGKGFEMNGIRKISIENLKLDKQNPRLPQYLKKDERSILNYIASTTAIEDLMSAIAQNGFFEAEPLVAIENPGDSDSYIVVEGNRRLTAVMLLGDPSLCDRPSRRMIELAEIAKPIYNDIRKLPVIVRKERKEILPFLGFRHITGVKQWEPLAKARYIQQLLSETDQNKEIDERYKEIAHIIGSRKDYIRRNLDALAVYDVAEGEDFYGIENLSEETIKFSVLSTALADETIGQYTGITSRADDGEIAYNNVIEHPNKIKKHEVKNLILWLFKPDDNGTTRYGESRNIII